MDDEVGVKTLPRILIIEDDANLAFGLRLNLEVEGYEVAVEGDGERATAALLAVRPDLVILDLMLPGVDGFELLRRWRTARYAMRVIVLSARAGEADRVAGLRLGAHDFITKPFSVLELLERVKLQLRVVSNGGTTPVSIQLGTVRLDLGARIVVRADRIESLAEKEMGLLSALLAARGNAVSKERLLREVWGYKARVETHTVEFHISSLRRKIELDPRNPKHILTIRKFGYRLEMAPAPVRVPEHR